MPPPYSNWTTNHPDSPFVIIEDVVMEFPKFSPTGLGMYTAAATVIAFQDLWHC